MNILDQSIQFNLRVIINGKATDIWSTQPSPVREILREALRRACPDKVFNEEDIQEIDLDNRVAVINSIAGLFQTKAFAPTPAVVFRGFPSIRS